MNAVLYFSCSGQSKCVADDLAKRLDWELFETKDAHGCYESVAVVFPVHCQSYPAPLKNFFKNLCADNVALIATYGRAHHGNAIYEATKLLKCPVTAAAYLPAKHAYSDSGDTAFVPEQLVKILRESKKGDACANIPKLRKTPFAAIFPATRSRAIIKIKMNGNCTKCNTCGNVCPVNAIAFGKPSSKCIRCLKCVYECPQNALYTKKSTALRIYLKKPRFDKILIYTSKG